MKFDATTGQLHQPSTAAPTAAYYNVDTEIQLIGAWWRIFNFHAQWTHHRVAMNWFKSMKRRRWTSALLHCPQQQQQYAVLSLPLCQLTAAHMKSIAVHMNEYSYLCRLHHLWAPYHLHFYWAYCMTQNSFIQNLAHGETLIYHNRKCVKQGKVAKVSVVSCVRIRRR